LQIDTVSNNVKLGLIVKLRVAVESHPLAFVLAKVYVPPAV